jgi:hypothetical protein
MPASPRARAGSRGTSGPPPVWPGAPRPGAGGSRPRPGERAKDRTSQDRLEQKGRGQIRAGHNDSSSGENNLHSLQLTVLPP